MKEISESAWIVANWLVGDIKTEAGDDKEAFRKTIAARVQFAIDLEIALSQVKEKP
jgi:hypothetical protein